ncbi:hypothetical protein ACFOMH_18080 [Paracoccus mangrovi]|uniref:Uncharacterized protein n=1 Tax=Paracoccus mangrovi TaxID=1715645 RepID=A0ABV7R8M7_9RHOB
MFCWVFAIPGESFAATQHELQTLQTLQTSEIVESDPQAEQGRHFGPLERSNQPRRSGLRNVKGGKGGRVAMTGSGFAGTLPGLDFMADFSRPAAFARIRRHSGRHGVASRGSAALPGGQGGIPDSP